MERLTAKTIGCFEYDIANFKHFPGEFAHYDAAYAYMAAVKRLGQYEDTNLTPEEITHLLRISENIQAENADLKEAMKGAAHISEVAGQTINKLQKELAALRAKIEDGTLVELPCRDQDTVYAIEDGNILEVFISQVSLHYGHKDGIRFECLLPERDHDYFAFDLSDIGKTVFTSFSDVLKSLEAAEAAKGEQV
jgi:hypothetical protein